MKEQGLISLDPIDRQRKKQDSVISRLFKTRRRGGRPVKKDDPFGHYLFCGPQ